MKFFRVAKITFIPPEFGKPFKSRLMRLLNYSNINNLRHFSHFIRGHLNKPHTVAAYRHLVECLDALGVWLYCAILPRLVLVTLPLGCASYHKAQFTCFRRVLFVRRVHKDANTQKVDGPSPT